MSLLDRPRPTPPVDPQTGMWAAPLVTIWRHRDGSSDSRPADSEGRILLGPDQLASTYTCMCCNKSWRYGDPGFDHFEFGPQGSPTEGMVVGTKGWFSRCADRDACEHRRANVHAGQHPEALRLEIAEPLAA